MPANYPKINDKFYQVGMRQPTLRAALETLRTMGDEFQKHPRETITDHDYRAIEDNTFSVMVGFADSVIARIRR